MEEANKLIGAGKKHLVMGNAVEAASVLQEACGMLAKTFGDTADECGEAFFWCGRALLDLARMENTVLGDALEGVPEEETEDGEKNKDSNVESTEHVDEKTRDELRAKVYDAMSEKINGEKQKDGKKAEDEDGEKTAEGEKGDEGEKKEKVEEGEKKGKNDQKSTPKKEGAGGVKGASPPGGESKENMEKMKEETAEKMEEGDTEEEEEADDDNDDNAEEAKGDGDEAKGSGDEDDEEVGNLQLAWEMLEVAKVIYKRKDTKEGQLLAAQAHLKLGEVSSESGNYSQALEDLQECLRLQQKHLEADSRLLAETHYQLGLTHTLHCQYGPAIQQLQNAAAVITSRLDNLQKMLERAGASEEVEEQRKEMEELGELLPELKEKVEDAQEVLKAALAEPPSEELNGVSTSSAFSAPSVQTGDASSSTATITAKPTNGVSSTNAHGATAPVSDISHLVRKRKPEQSPAKEGSTKRLKPEELKA
ncbi:histone-binding protein N1/N2-like isoform X4 [Gadus macrocephalus]|uniref:histone-binding protein N1/N2-like isoform X4 n=1 Tax=Gadus macrocephalus TaxID=80720 RepID=UPI0028CB9BCE|nr:histone-binding protein N1/N2-like isoform X4 [Gadus macrocephalus]